MCVTKYDKRINIVNCIFMVTSKFACIFPDNENIENGINHIAITHGITVVNTNANSLWYVLSYIRKYAQYFKLALFIFFIEFYLYYIILFIILLPTVKSPHCR